MALYSDQESVKKDPCKILPGNWNCGGIPSKIGGKYEEDFLLRGIGNEVKIREA